MVVEILTSTDSLQQYGWGGLDIPSNDIFYYDRTPSTDTDKFPQELSSFGESEQRLALAKAKAVLQQFRKERT